MSAGSPPSSRSTARKAPSLTSVDMGLHAPDQAALVLARSCILWRWWPPCAGRSAGRKPTSGHQQQAGVDDLACRSSAMKVFSPTLKPSRQTSAWILSRSASEPRSSPLLALVVEGTAVLQRAAREADPGHRLGIGVLAWDASRDSQTPRALRVSQTLIELVDDAGARRSLWCSVMAMPALARRGSGNRALRRRRRSGAASRRRCRCAPAPRRDSPAELLTFHSSRWREPSTRYMMRIWSGEPATARRSQSRHCVASSR